MSLTGVRDVPIDNKWAPIKWNGFILMMAYFTGASPGSNVLKYLLTTGK